MGAVVGSLDQVAGKLGTMVGAYDRVVRCFDPSDGAQGLDVSSRSLLVGADGRLAG